MQTKLVERVFDRVLRCPVPGIPNEEVFALENGYYVNNDETIICKSTDETGKYFRKLLIPKEADASK